MSLQEIKDMNLKKDKFVEDMEIQMKLLEKELSDCQLIVLSKMKKYFQQLLEIPNLKGCVNIKNDFYTLTLCISKKENYCISATMIDYANVHTSCDNLAMEENYMDENGEIKVLYKTLIENWHLIKKDLEQSIKDNIKYDKECITNYYNSLKNEYMNTYNLANEQF